MESNKNKSKHKVVHGFLLKLKNPKLFNRLDFEKTVSDGVDPEKLTFCSKVKVWWKCECGHSFKTSVQNMTNNDKCRICTNRQVMIGINDIFTVKPELKRQWDFEKNNKLGIFPEDCTTSSTKSVWWICQNCGNSFFARIFEKCSGKHYRVCQKCNVHAGTSFPEQAIKFYIQKIFNLKDVDKFKLDESNNMEIDILLKSLNVGIEYDGKYYHDLENEECFDREKRKYEICKKNKIYLIRVKEKECGYDSNVADKVIYNKNLNTCIIEIIDYISRTFNIEKIDREINVDKDISIILSRFRKIKREKSLGYNKPISLEFWDYGKNSPLTPYDISCNSNDKFWFRCKKCGIEFKETAQKFYMKKHSCRCEWKTSISRMFSVKVNQYDNNGVFLKTYDSLTSAAEEIGIDTSTISACCNKKINFVCDGKYIFRYFHGNTSNITVSRKIRLKRTLEQCLDIAKCYDSIIDLIRQNKKIYTYIQKHKWLSDLRRLYENKKLNYKDN